MLKKLTAVAASAAISVMASSAMAQIYKGETSAPGGATHAAMVAIAKIANDEADIDIQINDGQTLTSAAIKNAQGRIDFSIVPPAVYVFMTKGQAMYKKMGQDAIDASKNLRSIFAFTGGAFHPMTYADSGIMSLADLEGKKVFTGPPSGAASKNVEEVIKIETGLEAGKDYEAIHLNWGAGTQAMMDGKLDAMFNATTVGSANVEQIGLTNKIRFLGIDPKRLESPEYQEYLKVPGRAFGEIPANTYSGQVNDGAVTVPMYVMVAATRADLSDDLVYNITKAFWENLDAVHDSSALLKAINKESAFNALNIPLHKGAYRYYVEAGFDVPDAVKPE
ncbi:TAXI family TRAP transporter solute-binding subunit [Nitratireductor sp. XY-223]|uniref:TAXI family TRAP transporter solute-binding subunit n=1 Tax=Nitratireductor sp. XY-223 TaxID=2561926 RepID=UPI0010AA71ED|nr:TAXI family TRAP transporter solute-binding subunit [Nitratireductor sp. XY-223]